MSSISHASNHGFNLEISNVMHRLLKSLDGFFSAPSITKKARIWHGNFSYPLIPNTSIRNFYNMPSVTSIDTGDCYICIFEAVGYQGNYRIIGPGEKMHLTNCGSLVVSSKKFSVVSMRNNAKPSVRYWEMDGPTYMARFSSGYRYA